MKRDQYMGMDVHQATTVVVVLDAKGKRTLETIVATEAPSIIRILESLGGRLHVTFEETTQAAWLYEVVRGYVEEVVVCNPRRNKLLQEGSKGDKPDAWRLAELLRAGLLKPVYHGHEATRTLKELVRAYETLSADTVRVMQRIKAVYRGRGIRTPGTGVYQSKRRAQWLEQLTSTGLKQRTAWLYAQLDQLMVLRKQAKRAGGRTADNDPATGTGAMRPVGFDRRHVIERLAAQLRTRSGVSLQRRVRRPSHQGKYR